MKPRLTHSTVVGYLALFIALGGVSYGAATELIGSRDLRNNSVRSKDIRNRTVRSVDVRNGALRALDFAPGQLPAGEQGPKGDTGATGPPGPFPSSLPSGMTLRGIYAAEGKAAAAGEAVRDAPSFAFPVLGEPEPHVIPDGGPATAECPGNKNNPAAARGHLCVYEAVNTNATLGTDSAASTGSERFGWIAQVTSNAAGDYSSRGTWAVTAP